MPTITGKIENGVPKLRVTIYTPSAITSSDLSTTAMTKLGEFDAIVDTGAGWCVVPKQLVPPPLTANTAGNIVFLGNGTAGNVGGTVQTIPQGKLIYDFGSGIKVELDTKAVVHPGAPVLLGWPLLGMCHMDWNGPAGTFTLSW